MDSSGARTLAHLAREIGLDSLLLGYREYTLFAPWAGSLPTLDLSLDAPFWSLHLELYGSFLVLALVRLRTRSILLYRASIITCAAVFGSHPMFLFVLGHVSARWLRRTAVPAGGALLLALGLALSANKDWAVLELLRTGFARFAPVVAPNLYQFQSQLAATALFAGVLLSPGAQWLLSRAPCTWLGRLSFGIYLVHFPILFTLGCGAFLLLASALPYAVAVAATFAGFTLVVLIAAAAFERWVDRPAIWLSRCVAGVAAP